MHRIPEVIAHRGYTAEFPENTIPALQAAVAAGAPGVELDVQFTRDDVPVLLHDADLLRMTGTPGDILATDLAALRQLSAHEPGRLGERHRNVRFATLEEAAESLADAVDTTVFVEIKRDSLPIHRIPAGVQSVLRACRPLGKRLVVISFDDAVLQQARSLQHDVAVGWVLPAGGPAEAERAMTLAPEYLFCDYEYLPSPPASLWQGPWRWVAYEVNDVEEAKALRRRGIDCIETANVPAMVSALCG